VSLTSSQIQAIETRDINALDPMGLTTVQIGYLTTGQIRAISTDNISYISSDQIAALSSTQLSFVTTTQIQNFSSEQIEAIETRDIAGLTTAQIAALSSDQISYLSTNQFTKFSTSQIAAIETRDMVGLTSEQVAALSSAQIGSLTSTQFKAIGVDAIAGLTTTQVVALTSAQVRLLTTDQITSLSNDQIQAIETRDLVGLTSSQIAAISDAGLSFITAQDSKLTSTQLGSLTSTQISPLVLDLNLNGIQTASLANGVNFDLNNDGKMDRAGWVAGGDALLVRDLNGDGIINDGGELFGEGTVLADGRKANDGYQALSALDSNHDGVFDAKDAAFGSLKLWVDNGNGITDQGEMKSLADAGITSISLDAQTTTTVDNGNLIGLMGSYTTADGNTHTMGDVWFSVDASGNRTFDLAAAVQQSGSSNVNLGNASSDTMKVSLNVVLSLGQTDIAGVHHVTINGDASDTVQLSSASEGWTAAGSVSDGADTYMVYVNTNAQLLINDKIHTVIV
jgi:hypothetical protein